MKASLLTAGALACTLASLASAQQPARPEKPLTPRAEAELKQQLIEEQQLALKKKLTIQAQQTAAQQGTSPLATAGMNPPGSISLVASGSDVCGTPTPISGAGPFGYDTALQTTGAEGQANAICLFFGTDDIQNDAWFAWTSGAAGTYILSICGQGTNDSKIAVYNGSGCPGAAAIACNDDACGLQSQLSFAAAASTTYTLQIGKYPASADGAGTFSVSLAPPAPANDSCTTASAIAGAGPHAFDTTAATTGTEGQTENLCLAFASTAIDNDIWYNWTAGSSGLVTLSVCGQSSVDTKVGIYPGTPACPVSGSALACNDDLCGLQSELCWNATSGQTYTIQMGTFPGGTGGTGTFAISVGVCVNPPGVGVTFCEPGIAGVIVCPCGNAPSGPGRGCDNSDATGGAALHSEGIGRLSADTLVFKTAGQRLTGPSLVLQGTTEIANGVTYGDGVRCLGGAIIRLYTRNAVGGQISAPQVGDTPKNISGRSASLGNPIFAGQTRYYMVYYRDAAPSFACPGPGSSLFNTSSAKRIQWIL